MSWTRCFPPLLSRLHQRHDFLALVLKLRDELGWTNTNEGELIAFIAYAQALHPLASPRRLTP